VYGNRFKFNAKPPKFPKYENVFACAPGDHAETEEIGHQIKSQSYVRARPTTFKR